jgi:hypothetical protein
MQSARAMVTLGKEAKKKAARNDPGDLYVSIKAVQASGCFLNSVSAVNSAGASVSPVSASSA